MRRQLPVQFFALVASFIIVWAISFLQDLESYSSEPPQFDNRIWLANVNGEGTAFAWASTISLFLASVLLFQRGNCVPSNKRFHKVQWQVLGFIFFYLSADEMLSLHEKLADPASEMVNATGALFFPWVIIAGPIVGLIAIMYIPFLLEIPRRMAIMVIASGTLYVGGAIGMEMVAAVSASANGFDTVDYRIRIHIEEAMEAAGILLFVATLLIFDLHPRERAVTAS